MLNEESEKRGWLRWRDWWTDFNWEETRAGVDRESRARVLLLGLAGSGKSTLFNRLCGWTVSTPAIEAVEHGGQVEDYGLFCLIDLPEETADYDGTNGFGLGVDVGNGLGGEQLWLNGWGDPFLLAEDADLLVYVLDGAVGVRAADYRWIGRLRRLGLPLLAVLNKSDLIEEEAAQGQAEIEQRLAISVLPISALKGTNVPTRLLPQMIDACPNLAVALGRELGGFRRQAARYLIRRAAIINGFIALEPVPLLDLPLQLMTLVGMILRIAAVYNRPPTASYRREVIAAVMGGLVGRYAAQQALKLVPVVGWIASGFVGMSSAWLLGQAAVAYFEVGGDAAIARRWRQTQTGLGRAWQPIRARWQRWVVTPWRRLPYPQVRWIKNPPPSDERDGSGPDLTRAKQG